MTEFLPHRRRMRNIAGICVVAITAAVALQGCASSGTLAVVVPGGTTSPAVSTGTATTSSVSPPGRPLTGNMLIDAPASGSTFNLYWQQAVGPVGGVMSGVILIRNIPIN